MEVGADDAVRDDRLVLLLLLLLLLRIGVMVVPLLPLLDTGLASSAAPAHPPTPTGNRATPDGTTTPAGPFTPNYETIEYKSNQYHFSPRPVQTSKVKINLKKITVYRPQCSHSFCYCYHSSVQRTDFVLNFSRLFVSREFFVECPLLLRYLPMMGYCWRSW